jgi:hypothetical protein
VGTNNVRRTSRSRLCHHLSHHRPRACFSAGRMLAAQCVFGIGQGNTVTANLCSTRPSQEREGRGTHFAPAASEFKSLGHPPAQCVFGIGQRNTVTANLCSTRPSQEREERGTHFAPAASEFKSLGHPPKLGQPQFVWCWQRWASPLLPDRSASINFGGDPAARLPSAPALVRGRLHGRLGRCRRLEYRSREEGSSTAARPQSPG